MSETAERITQTDATYPSQLRAAASTRATISNRISMIANV